MKILLLADQAVPVLWEDLDRRKLEGVDLILSCGDLPAEYLSFLTCFTEAPILYIHGNHDDRYATHPPEGCICIEYQIYTYGGVRILGLGAPCATTGASTSIRSSRCAGASAACASSSGAAAASTSC